MNTFKTKEKLRDEYLQWKDKQILNFYHELEFELKWNSRAINKYGLSLKNAMKKYPTDFDSFLRK